MTQPSASDPLHWYCSKGHDRGVVPTSAAFTLTPCAECGDGIWVTQRFALATPPPALDVERLARALHRERELFFGYDAPCSTETCGCVLTAPSVAAEYARLSEEPR